MTLPGAHPDREHLNAERPPAAVPEKRMSYATSSLAPRKLAAHVATLISLCVADAAVLATIVLEVR